VNNRFGDVNIDSGLKWMEKADLSRNRYSHPRNDFMKRASSCAYTLRLEPRRFCIHHFTAANVTDWESGSIVVLMDLANPKSNTFTDPSRRILIFAGFRSR
jgi:hypothetical protein